MAPTSALSSTTSQSRSHSGRLCAIIEQDFSGAETYSFDKSGREAFVDIMKNVGYVELPEFIAIVKNGYWCVNCPAMKRTDNSPTKWWCQKFQFPDRPNGCCSGWYPKP